MCVCVLCTFRGQFSSFMDIIKPIRIFDLSPQALESLSATSKL